MCTIIVLNDCVEGYPLIIAANRDERYDRASTAPERHHVGGTDFIRPWDDEKYGTWIGVARDGWFVGLTNQDDGKHDEYAESRGKLVAECLYGGNHAYVAKVLAHVDMAHYNPFNLVFGRPGAVMLARMIVGAAPEFIPLTDRITVISNDCWGSAYNVKLNWAEFLTQMAISHSDRSSNGIVNDLFEVLRSHNTFPITAGDPFQQVCVHAEEHAFGTRSSSIITVSNEKVVEYYYSEGHPCASSGVHLVERMNYKKEDA